MPRHGLAAGSSSQPSSCSLRALPTRFRQRCRRSLLSFGDPLVTRCPQPPVLNQRLVVAEGGGEAEERLRVLRANTKEPKQWPQLCTRST